MNYSGNKRKHQSTHQQILQISQISKNKNKDNRSFMSRITMSMMIQKMKDINNMSKWNPMVRMLLILTTSIKKNKGSFISQIKKQYITNLNLMAIVRVLAVLLLLQQQPHPQDQSKYYNNLQIKSLAQSINFKTLILVVTSTATLLLHLIPRIYQVPTLQVFRWQTSSQLWKCNLSIYENASLQIQQTIRLRST